MVCIWDSHTYSATLPPGKVENTLHDLSSSHAVILRASRNVFYSYQDKEIFIMIYNLISVVHPNISWKPCLFIE